MKELQQLIFLQLKFHSKKLIPIFFVFTSRIRTRDGRVSSLNTSSVRGRPKKVFILFPASGQVVGSSRFRRRGRKSFPHFVFSPQVGADLLRVGVLLQRASLWRHRAARRRQRRRRRQTSFRCQEINAEDPEGTCASCQKFLHLRQGKLFK